MKRIIKYKALNLLAISFIFLMVMISCGEITEPVKQNNDVTHECVKPDSLGDGWEVDYPLNVGLDESMLMKMLDYLNKKEHRIHSILIVKNGKLVFEEYFHGYKFADDPPGSNGDYISYKHDEIHYLASISKSITSTVFCIAVDKGFIPGVDKKLVDEMPQYSSVLKDNKANITLKHLLTMTAGLAWDESSYPYGDTRNDVTALFYKSNPISFILSKSLLTNPGTSFLYSSGCPNVIAHLITEKTGMNFLSFAKKYLFDPLEIDVFQWQKISGQYYFASGGLWLYPRSLAKIGFLYLNNGFWKGEKIISGENISQSISRNVTLSGSNICNGYGYYWWTNSKTIGSRVFDYVFAAGWGEQFLYLVPGENMLVIFNCGYFTDPITVSPHYIFSDYILKALKN